MVTAGRGGLDPGGRHVGRGPYGAGDGGGVERDPLGPDVAELAFSPQGSGRTAVYLLVACGAAGGARGVDDSSQGREDGCPSQCHLTAHLQRPVTTRLRLTTPVQRHGP